jgi:transcriptional regulator
MYTPPAFVEDRPEELHEIMRAASLPVLISPVRDAAVGVRMVATHLPLMLDGGRLIGHVARANEQWRNFDPAAESLAVFAGVDGYVSPSHYATKAETGRVVPTWNYQAVHAYGRLEIVEDSTPLLDIVTKLTERFEGPRAKPWAVSDAPADYIAAQLKGIVGVVLHITRLQGVRKLSQNKSAADQEGVLAGQVIENPALAAAMRRLKPGGSE